MTSMTYTMRKIQIIFFVLILGVSTGYSQRWMENLDRGVVAVKRDNSNAFISWRLFGYEDQNIGFNLYRQTGTDTPVMLNTDPITGGTNWEDNNIDLSVDNSYFVEPVLNGVIGETSGVYTLKGTAPVGQFLSVPLQSVGEGTDADWYVHLSWVGDLDGDGEFDFVVDRIPFGEGAAKVDAYLRDGTFLWRADCGPNSLNRNGIEGGPSVISNGHWDGVTVYDLNNDGKAEVIIKTANNFVFGDGAVLSHSNDVDQFLSVLDGMTGEELSTIMLPRDYQSDGPLQAHLGIAYLDGENPSIIVKAKNRIGSAGFNLVMSAYSFLNGEIQQQWQWKREGTNAPDFHQIRTLDVDGDGKDEICDGGYVINGDGTLKYSIPGVVHGDRFHISDLDPSRPGLEGFGIQQDNASKLATYYYDAANGDVIRGHYTDDVVDAARGIAADIDPNLPGYEYWSFYGIHNATSGELVDDGTNRPWPNYRIWWDGDLLSENLNRELIEKFDYNSGTCCARLLTAYQDGASKTWRDSPTFYGDIFGDWREEVIWENGNRQELLIFTTTTPTAERLYTLPHNPQYRLNFTYKGYMQSNMVDYYLGHGMTQPPMPNIKIVNLNLDCAGIDNGTAILDECGTCTGGNTGVEACSGAIQGEDFCEAMGVSEITNAGFVGEGYLNFDYVMGSTGTWYIHSDDAGTKVLGLRYANGGANARSMTVAVNGNVQTTFNGNQTGAWDAWQTENITLELEQGINQLVFTGTNEAGGPNIDAIGFVSTGLTAGGCTADCNGIVGGIAYTDECGTCVGGNTGVEACVQDCEGNWGGTAQSDDCGVCLTDNTILPCSGSLEAEASCNLDGTVDNDNEGYSGDGFVNTFNEIEASVSWILNSSSAQTATITFVYANGGTPARDGSILINGSNIGTLAMPSTGSWSTWNMVSVNVDLVQGANEVLLTATTANGLANIDQLHFSEGVSDANCLITVISKTNNSSLEVYPNPVHNTLHLSNVSDWVLETSSGEILNTGKSSKINTSALANGTYLLKAGGVTFKIIKE